MDASAHEITRLLQAWSEGDQSALERLIPTPRGGTAQAKILDFGLAKLAPKPRRVAETAGVDRFRILLNTGHGRKTRLSPT